VGTRPVAGRGWGAISQRHRMSRRPGSFQRPAAAPFANPSPRPDSVVRISELASKPPQAEDHRLGAQLNEGRRHLRYATRSARLIAAFSVDYLEPRRRNSYWILGGGENGPFLERGFRSSILDKARPAPEPLSDPTVRPAPRT